MECTFNHIPNNITTWKTKPSGLLRILQSLSPLGRTSKTDLVLVGKNYPPSITEFSETLWVYNSSHTVREETTLSIKLGPSDKGQYEWVFFFPHGWQKPNQAAISSSHGQRLKGTSSAWEKKKKKEIKKSYVTQQVEHDCDRLHTLLPGTVFTAWLQRSFLLGLCTFLSKLKVFRWGKKVLM